MYVDTANLDGGLVSRGATVTNQAGFISTVLSDGAGGFHSSVTLGQTGTLAAADVTAQSSAVRGLYVAHCVTGDATFSTAADEGYSRLVSDYYLPSSRIFRTSIGGNEATYTPQTVAIIAGALREATLEGGKDDAAGIYVNFFRHVGNIMQLSEAAARGETGQDSDGDGIPFIPEQPEGLPPVFASRAVFTLAP